MTSDEIERLANRRGCDMARDYSREMTKKHGVFIDQFAVPWQPMSVVLARARAQVRANEKKRNRVFYTSYEE